MGKFTEVLKKLNILKSEKKKKVYHSAAERDLDTNVDVENK